MQDENELENGSVDIGPTNKMVGRRAKENIGGLVAPPLEQRFILNNDLFTRCLVCALNSESTTGRGRENTPRSDLNVCIK